jgi:hypothetical protein
MEPIRKNIPTTVKVDVYSGATAMRRAMKLLRWRSDTIAKSLLFCRVATIVFFLLLSDFDSIFYDFRWQLLRDGSDIDKKLK